MVLRRRELIRISSQEMDRIRAPGGQEEAERREEHRVPAQEAVGVRARSGTRSQGRTKKGEMIATARRFPYFTGRVAHPPARSPAASEKSFVEAAPSRNRPNTDPMAQGSAENAEAVSYT